MIFTITDQTNLATPRVTLTWTPSTDPNFWAYRIYIKPLDSIEWTMVRQTTLISTSSYIMYAFANKTQQIGLALVTQNPTTGVITEGAYDEQSFTPQVNTGYSIIIDNDITNSLPVIKTVTEDSFEPADMERQQIDLIGKGRKFNVGINRGVSGSMTLTLADHATYGTARQQRKKLENIHSKLTPVLLRTPFGDLWRVVIESMSVERIQAGSHEMVEVSIDYVQVV